jgi:nucleoside-diphosphate-sugar epimerase
VKVFVTGGTGLVGRHVIEQLHERGDQVLALARSDESAALLSAAGAEPLRGTLMDGAVLEAGIAAAEAVVHAGAIILRGGAWQDYHVANVEPTERIARAAARLERRLVHISSVSVYGRRTTYDGGPRSVSEDFGLERPLFEGDHYARSKREAEQAVWRVAEGTRLRAVALRPCVIYGEWDRTFAIRVARVVRRGVAPVIGAGDNAMSVVYAGNVAAAALSALDRPAVTGPFNVANDGPPVTQRGFLEAFARGMNVKLRLLRVPRGPALSVSSGVDSLVRLMRQGSSMTTLKTAVQFLGAENPYVSDRAREVLGWKPRLTPLDAVERTGRWFLKNSGAR